jgi:hypothetical protein
VHDEKKGMLTYLRVYSGKLKPSEKLYNSNIKEPEKPLKLFRVLADDMESLPEVNLLCPCPSRSSFLSFPPCSPALPLAALSLSLLFSLLPSH